MLLSLKEIDALRWIAEDADLGAIEVTEWRDGGDVGWLYVGYRRSMRGTTRQTLCGRYVSPLGHVYGVTPMLTPDLDEVLREGVSVTTQAVTTRAS